MKVKGLKSQPVCDDCYNRRSVLGTLVSLCYHRDLSHPVCLTKALYSCRYYESIMLHNSYSAKEDR